MAQIPNVGQGPQSIIGPVSATMIILMGFIFALLGIKLWGFKRRLNFEKSNTGTRSAQASIPAPPRYIPKLQVNGTDSAIHGVFRQRNTEDFESTTPSSTAAGKKFTRSIPNLRLTIGIHQEKKNEAAKSNATLVLNGQNPQAPRRLRREVQSTSFEYCPAQPTRDPPAPPISVADHPTELGVPNFDHFAEKYELLTANSSTDCEPLPLRAKKNYGGYVKYDQVDDDLGDLSLKQEPRVVPELLTPDENPNGIAIPIVAVVHNALNEEKNDKTQEEFPELTDTSSSSIRADDSAFVVEIIAGTPEAVGDPIERNLFADLETIGCSNSPISGTGGDFLRIRSSCELNEADILDNQQDFDHLQLDAPKSPPGFGKSIDEDWENFENLDSVILPEPNWLVHPNQIERTEAALILDTIDQVESLFQNLELIEPAPLTTCVIQEHPIYPVPPPYEPYTTFHNELGQLPDYESIMHHKSTQLIQTLPNYADVVANKDIPDIKYIETIEDLFSEIQPNETDPTKTVNDDHSFENLCYELEIAPTLRPAPQPAPRYSKSKPLNVRGNTVPMLYYQPEELLTSSESDENIQTTGNIVELSSPPQPAKRNTHKRKVRFDVENLQYYQSATLPSSSESDENCRDTDDTALKSPQPIMRFKDPGIVDYEVPMLFGTQVSDGGDEGSVGRDMASDSWQAINQHRSMTEELRRPHMSETYSGREMGAVPKRPVVKLLTAVRDNSEA